MREEEKKIAIIEYLHEHSIEYQGLLSYKGNLVVRGASNRRGIIKTYVGFGQALDACDWLLENDHLTPARSEGLMGFILNAIYDPTKSQIFPPDSFNINLKEVSLHSSLNDLSNTRGITSYFPRCKYLDDLRTVEGFTIGIGFTSKNSNSNEDIANRLFDKDWRPKSPGKQVAIQKGVHKIILPTNRPTRDKQQ